MTAQTDARGQRTDWRSDALGRMRMKTANALTAPDLTEYFYDETRQAGSFGASGVTFHNGGKLSRQVRGGVSQRQDHDANGFKVKDSATVDGVTIFGETIFGDRIHIASFPAFISRAFPSGFAAGHGSAEPCFDPGDERRIAQRTADHALRLEVEERGVFIRRQAEQLPG
jgi:hypothetical protein